VILESRSTLHVIIASVTSKRYCRSKTRHDTVWHLLCVETVVKPHSLSVSDIKRLKTY